MIEEKQDHWLQRLVDRLFSHEVIDGAECFPEPHFHRWTLARLPGGPAAYLHHFKSSDHWPNPHDHPKTFISIGLKGEYNEYSFDGDRPEMHHFKAPWIRKFPPEHKHQIMLIQHKPVWTLVLVGPKRREWGYWTDSQGFVWWKTYVMDPFNRDRISKRIY